VKYTTEKGLAERVNIQGSLATTYRLSDNSTFHKCFRRTVGHHLAILLLLLISIGLGFGTATAQAQIRAYVANAGDSFTANGTVSVIDTATNSVVATIPVGPIPFAPIGVAITPDGTRAYVTNAGDPFNSANGTVSVIDTATNTVVASIPVGILPEAVAITPDGTRAYVANTTSGTASVIDIVTNTVVATVAGLLGPLGVAITPGGTEPM
jgi:YVTN family beta-propeller protein